MGEKQVDDALGRVLRAGDPGARTSGLEPAEGSAMRRRVLAAHRQRRERPNGWLVPATTVVALLALALGLAWRARESPLLTTAQLSQAPIATPSDSEGQQVQFTTENGTLVVWVLLPRSTD